MAVSWRGFYAIVDPDVEVSNEGSATAPIPGLQNPPDPDPEQLYPGPAKRWRLRLDDLRADAVREIWIGDYRLEDEAHLEARLSVIEPQVSLPLVGILAVAVKALVRQDRADIAIELQLIRGCRVRGMSQPKGNQAAEHQGYGSPAVK